MNIDEQERTEFEAWYRLHHGSRDVYGRDASGEYVDKQVQGAFNVWQARAALDRAETSWQRGFQHGLEANRLMATQAMDALKKEREAHAETNRTMTDALMMMEEREQRDEGLLRQALEALEVSTRFVYADLRPQCECAIAALRERLAETANDLNRCPNCGGPADNGHDREVPPNPYWCSKCTES